MSYRIILTPRAEKDLLAWKKSGQLKALKKIHCIMAELIVHPREGTGKAEPLKGDRQGQWSRRIDKHNRMIYTIHDDIVEVHVISMLGHYE